LGTSNTDKSPRGFVGRIRWLRQHYLANQSFTDYNDIVSKVCRAWNGFLECKDRVTKMSRRDWINLIS
ncbi:hypothetical protein AB6D15_24210, partial [Vibrio splendidus]